MSLRIKNWEKFQHYQHGRGAPPWVKIYRGLLNDKDWFALPGDAAKTLINLWLLAAEHEGELPDSDTLAFRLRLDSKVLAQHLIACSGWLIDDDSTLLATCYQLATPETETETETELTTVSLSAPQSAKADTAAKTPKRVSKRAKQLQIAELSMTADQAGAWDRIKTAWPRKGWNSQTRSEQPRFTNPARAGAWFKEICNDAPIELSEGQRITPADLADATIAWLQKRWKETARGGSPVVPCIENFFSCDPASKLHWQSALLEHFGVSEAS